MSEPVCRFCEETPDGDRFSFVDARRTRCNKVRCVLMWEQEYDRACRNERDRNRFMREQQRKDAGRRGRRRMFRRAA